MNTDKCKAKQSRLLLLTSASVVIITIVCIYLRLSGQSHQNRANPDTTRQTGPSRLPLAENRTLATQRAGAQNVFAGQERSRLPALPQHTQVDAFLMRLPWVLWGVTEYWGAADVEEYLAQKEVAVEDDGIIVRTPFVIEARELRVLIGPNPLEVYINSFTLERKSYFWFFGYITEL